jgi:predicted RNase H-like nuclease
VTGMHGPRVVGLDGCPAGWIASVWRGPGHQPDVVLLKSLERAETELPAATAVIAIDIPLGLLDAAVPGGRACDREARSLLGPGRTSSVFSPPARQALAAKTHAEASQLNRNSGPTAGGLSIQAFAIFPKLRDADEASGSLGMAARPAHRSTP